MSNVEQQPAELQCRPAPRDGAQVQVVGAREVPLGGPRALTVRRTLPHRERSFIGAWCFADHYGPAKDTMDVPPHPHTGLQTVSWLFSGEVEHRDSLGTHTLIRPGEMNLMTSGRGITHSEVSTRSSDTLHGVQLWVALPKEHATGTQAFENYRTEAVELGDLDGASATGSGQMRVFLGDLAGVASPIQTFTPLLGAELTIAAGGSVKIPVRSDYEHGVLADTGSVEVNGTHVTRGDLAYVPEGHSRLRLTAAGDEPARVILLGGMPFDEEIIMWWNFVGRTHEEIVEARDSWQEQSERFGRVTGYGGPTPWLRAPDLPRVRLKPRRR